MLAKNIFTWVLKLLAVAIMGMTLYFKFTADPQSVKLFTMIGMEPWGRIGIGIMELIACILILIPRTAAFGALLGMGLMAGAMFFHFTKLGIYFDGDPWLFIYALTVFVCCTILVIILRGDILHFAGLKTTKPATL
jgi:uncharacterized membrane protein YphA (DoxX/SURF4 family)